MSAVNGAARGFQPILGRCSRGHHEDFGEEADCVATTAYAGVPAGERMSAASQ